MIERGYLTEEDIKIVVEAANKLEELYRETGLISLDSSFGRTGVHLSLESFKDTFNNWQVEEGWSGNTNKLKHDIEGVEFYALEKVERPEPEDEQVEEHQTNLPALIMTPEKINIILMLIDFYRLKQRPDEQTDAMLTRLKKEISEVR